MSVNIWDASSQDVKKLAGNVNINDGDVSSDSTWSSKKINDSLVDIDADNVNITKEDDTKKSLQAMYEDGELGGGGGGVDKYSTEEVKTNKVWIDGKPIYRKTVIRNYGGDTIFATNVAELVSVYGQFEMSGLKIGIPFGSPSYYFTAIVNSSSEVALYTNHSSYIGYKITIEYTKTTD